MFRLLQLCLLASLTLWSLLAAAAMPAPVQLDEHRPVVDGWPAVTMLADPSHHWTLDDVLRRSSDFKPPEGVHANLGMRREAIWLRLPLQVQQGGRWVMEIDYPPLNRIDVVVHPQSIVHSMVEFVDGSTIAQASPPDMRLPISLGLDWPNRVAGVGRPLDWTVSSQWTFEPLDTDVSSGGHRVADRGRIGLAERSAKASGRPLTSLGQVSRPDQKAQRKTCKHRLPLTYLSKV